MILGRQVWARWAPRQALHVVSFVVLEFLDLPEDLETLEAFEDGALLSVEEAVRFLLNKLMRCSCTRDSLPPSVKITVKRAVGLCGLVKIVAG